VFFGPRFLMKVFRRVDEGVNPDFEVSRFLTERTMFDRTPRVAGAIEYDRPGCGPVTLAILQERVKHQADGWAHALAEIGRHFERADGTAAGDYPAAAETLGRRTAELHLALSSDATDPAFAPEPITAADVEALREEIRIQARTAFDTLRDTLDRLTEAVIPPARRLLDVGPAAVVRFAARGTDVPAATKIRVHGDYHLGQVLWAEGDFYILDFEGEPAKPIAVRRSKQSALKDVAGMMRSFSYAAAAGLFASSAARPDAAEHLTRWSEQWEAWTTAAFLRGYFDAVDGALFVPAAAAQRDELLQLFVLEKALYELNYELNNRPDWLRIPLSGILRLLS
jgi:maltose alpha-D-glucosyltransferase/alpha-amylase